MASKTDVFQSPDYYLLDELLSEEHKLVRETIRTYVKKEISPLLRIMRKKPVFPNKL